MFAAVSLITIHAIKQHELKLHFRLRFSYAFRDRRRTQVYSLYPHTHISWQTSTVTAKHVGRPLETQAAVEHAVNTLLQTAG